MKLQHPTLIVVCGWPVSGKTTIAKILEERLNADLKDPAIPKVHRVDIDEVRRVSIGLPYPHPDESEMLMAKDRLEMGGAYRLLLETADWHLEQGRSVIVTATFSRNKGGQSRILELLEKHTNTTLKVVQCLPTNDPQEEIERRLARGFGEGYVGGVNSYKRYLEVKNRYEPIELPHIEIDTSPPHTPEECAAEALRHILH